MATGLAHELNSTAPAIATYLKAYGGCATAARGAAAASTRLWIRHGSDHASWQDHPPLREFFADGEAQMTHESFYTI